MGIRSVTTIRVNGIEKDARPDALADSPKKDTVRQKMRCRCIALSRRRVSC